MCDPVTDEYDQLISLEEARHQNTGFCFNVAIGGSALRLVIHLIQTTLFIVACILITFSPWCTFYFRLPDGSGYAITVDCEKFNISSWGKFPAEIAKLYEKFGLNATDVPPGANHIQGQYGIMVLSVIMSATTFILVICELLGSHVPKITHLKSRWYFQYLIHAILAVISALCSGLEFWMAFGFGFLAEALVTAVKLEAKNVERLLLFIFTLPQWLQHLIRHELDKMLGDIERKYLEERFVTFINIAWIFAALCILVNFVLAVFVVLANWTLRKAKKELLINREMLMKNKF